MILKEDTPEVRYIAIIINDESKTELGRVIWFDTETKEAEIYVTLDYKDSSKQSRVAVKRDKYSEENNLTSIINKGYRQDVVTAKVTLLGHIAIDKRTGKEIV